MPHIREVIRLSPMEKALRIARDLRESPRKPSTIGLTAYECNICKDTGYIYNAETKTAEPCKCFEVKRGREILKKCGIAEAFKNKTFDNYTPVNTEIERLKKIASKYVNGFDENSEKGASIGFFGQSGAGKTHLTIAIANELMKRNIAVRYMPYIEKITELKNLNRSGDTAEDFNRLMNDYKKVMVLLIDDMFKSAKTYSGEVNYNDVRIMMDIINHRCLKGLSTVFSSEYTPFEIIKIDEALGGRIIEMCGENIAVIKKDIHLNYRFRGIV